MSTRAPLVLAVAQPRCASHDVAANVEAHAAAVRAARARVVVFPELSLTGYELDAALVPADDPRLAPLVAACAEMDAVALAGAPVPGGAAGPSIAVLACDASGVRVAYRKMWLSTEESRRFAPGPAPAVLPVDGWRLGLAVCKDTGVVQHARDTVALGVDAYVAGTVKAVAEAPVQAERARRVAIGHGVWVAVASMAGPSGGGYAPAAGCSGIWAPGGEAVVQAGPHPGALVRATLDPRGRARSDARSSPIAQD